MAASNWSLLASVWPVEDRPANLMREDVVNSIEFSTLLAMAKYQKESRVGATDGVSKASYTKDSLPPSTLFKEEKDNGVKKLHSARFKLRLPLTDPKKWWHKVPLKREHKYRAIPLKFLGCQGQVSEKTIENAHDRSVPHQLKHFCRENISVSAKPLKKIERKDEDGLSTVYDYLWEEPTTMTHIQDALINYQAVMQHLWPIDPTGIIISKLLTKYKWINGADGMKERVAVCTAFFNSVMRENAGRAVRGEVIMSFSEQELLLKDVLVAHGVSSSVPLGRIPKQEGNKVFKKPAQEGKQAPTGAKRTSGAKFQVARVGNLGCCYGFNDINGCKNATKTKAGCKDSLGREFAHACNKFLTASQVHCLGDHSRTKHP